MAELNQAISHPMDSCSYKPMSGANISRVSVQPENRQEIALTQGNTCDIYFSIPSRDSTFLSGMGSYLSFTYSFENTVLAGAEVASIAQSPASFIQTLEVTAGSVSLELINDYGVLASLVDDFQYNDRCKTLGTILQDKDKTNAKRCIDRTVATQSQDRRVCIPLLSLACGTLQDKYLPIGKDIGLRLRLTMADPLIAMVSNAVGILGYKLKDITYEAEMITVPSQIYSSILQESDGLLKISGTGISSFGVNGSAGATSQTIMIPARYSSVRNFFTANRTAGNLIAKNENSVGSRCRDSITSYQYRISGVPYPNLPIVADPYTSAETMTHLLKCWSAHADLSMSVAFDRESFVHNTGTGSQGSFAMGIDFEEAAFSARQMSGKNTSSGNTFLDIGYSAPSTATVFTTFCFYDCIIEISANGEVMVSK
jgi:hypothetical protein